MALVPSRLIVLNDTSSAFENRFLLDRMVETNGLIEQVRAALKT